MKLSVLCARFGAPIAADAEIVELCTDSRLAAPQHLFFCLRGQRADGHRFAAEAYRRGCRAFVSEQALSLPSDATVLRVQDSRLALAHACAAFFGAPYPLTLVGITGTKGKTTVTSYLYEMLVQNRRRVLRIGTGGMLCDGIRTATCNTTPDCYTLHRALRQFADSGGEIVLLEVSSQAIYQQRVAGLIFDLAIFTNLFPDHIGAGEHPDFAHYRQCKLALFDRAAYGILNADDPAFAEFAARCPRYRSYGFGDGADLRATHLTPLAQVGISFSLARSKEAPFALALPGKHNVANALAAMSAGLLFGIPFADMRTALTRPVAGRFETIPLSNGATAVLDYAHNGGALTAALQALRPYCRGKLFCVFGSVGGRCQSRRAALGKAAAAADFCILTADDPDFEDPRKIALEIAAALPKSTPYVILSDRAEAIRFALNHSQAQDLILFAGKGAETSQRICGISHPFSERQVIEAWEREKECP